MTVQESLKNLFESKLEANSYGVDFHLDLFNSNDIDYFETNEDGQRVRFVPTMINDIVGEYLNVPNANSTSNDTSLLFDIFVDYTGDYEDNIDNELEYVGYNNTLNAIEEFKASLLAQYFPLGTPYLYMGGVDSTFTFQVFNIVNIEYMKFSFVPKNTDNEDILTFNNNPNALVHKTSTNIVFQSAISNTIFVPYTVNEEVTITIYKNDDGFWTITNGTNSYNTNHTTAISESSFTIGDDGGIECIFEELIIGEDNNIVIDDWNSKTKINNSGDNPIQSSSISNCILWSTDGNAVFGFGTLSPTTDMRVIDGRYVYQGFELPISVFVSNDVLFGNNFEYYLDGEQIYPIDRQHSMATEIGSAQYINSNENEHIVEESSRDHTLSFYYIPSKKLNSLLKHIVTGNTAQNTTYTLLVQYPFFQVTYEVLLDTGGTQPNINTISSFTLTFKKSDSNL